MRSTNNRRAVIVGIVMLLGLAIFLTAIFTLGGQKKTFAKTITLRAVFNDVNGLQKGNNVWFSGVKVGTIKSVNFDESAHVVISMNVEEKVQRFIHKNAFAKVGSDGLIGNKIVVIYGGNAQSPVVEKDDMLSVEKVTSTDDIIDTLQQNNKNLVAITANLKIISQQIASGQGTIGKLLTNDEMANTLQATLNTLNATANNAKSLSNNLNSYTAKLSNKGTFANDLVTDTAVFRRLRASVDQIEAVAINAEHATANLANSQNSAVGVLLNDPEAAANLKATLLNLNLGTSKLDTNMEALKHNIFFRGFYKKKAKKEAKALKENSSGNN